MMGIMTRNGERTERKMVLKSQTTYERADNPAENKGANNGNMEDIGGEVCPREGVAIPVAVKGELCVI